MPKRLSGEERAVLRVFIVNGEEWMDWFDQAILDAVGGNTQVAKAACVDLRRRGMLDSRGRGIRTRYGITESGRLAAQRR